MSKKNEALDAALEVLKKELKKEPISAERVAALSGTIKVLSEINPLSLS